MHPGLLTTIGFTLLVIALFEIILGLLLLVNNPRNSRVQRSVAHISLFAAAFALITALMYLLGVQGSDITLLARANWVGWLTLPAAFQFIYYMQDENSRTARIGGYLIYAFWTLVLVISVSSDLIKRDHYQLYPYFNQDGPLGGPLRLAGSLLVFWIAYEIIKLRRRVSGIKKIQLHYFTFGLLVFGVGTVAVSGLFQLFGGFGLEPGLGSFFGLPWVVLTFVAITRHRLFDVRSVISRTVTILVLSSLLALVQIAAFRYLEPVLGHSLAIAVSLVMLGFAFFGTTFSKRVQTAVRRAVERDRFNYQEILKESIKAILTKLDSQDLMNYLMMSISRSLGVKIVCLFLKEKEGLYKLRARGEDSIAHPSCVENAQVMQWIENYGKTVILEDLYATPAATADLQECMVRFDLEVIIPLFSNGSLLGVLVLGPKGNRDPYLASDIDLLETLAGHAAVAIENASLYEDAHQAKVSLQVSETKFRMLTATMPAAVFIHRGDSILYANPMGETMAGYSQAELLRMEFLQVVHPDHRALVRDRARMRFEGDDRTPQCEFKILRKDGAERWVLMTATVIAYDDSPAILGTLFDITERKALEGRLRYGQKMEAIGKLAGGVAHDFNNVLTAIVGYANLLYVKLRKDDPLRAHVDQILAASERAANMTQTLLAFGKKQVISLKPENLTTIVQRMEKLLGGLVREGVELKLRVAERPLPVLADSNQIERIIMNLLVNARDAMPNGGKITIETGSAILDGEFIKNHGYGRSGPFAVVSVRDTGTGIDPAIMDKIFEPFFSTKGLEKGTGFGLSIAYDIVKDHMGYITVDSEKGAGATFRVYLPLTDAKVEAHGAEVGISAATESGQILLAENEDEVREIMKAVLKGYGYTVIEAVDGQDAVAKFAKYDGSLQLVILDVIMPKLNGIEVYKEIRKSRPRMKVLFTSGYAEDVVQQHGILDGSHPFIEKPFSPKELVSRVQKIIAEPS